ncbi:MAG: Zn-ribbon domain-containing OB-fold protein [Candidatus Diapherotrites archaeon]
MTVSAPMNWRRIPERYRLKGTYCETCKTAFFPTRVVCPNCRRKGKLVEQEMPRTGKIHSYTRVHVGPTGFSHETPYYLALIELENKAKVLAQIVDSEEKQIKIGAKVQLAFRRIGQADKYGAINYAYKFKVMD